jgi:hypothetical protein
MRQIDRRKFIEAAIGIGGPRGWCDTFARVSTIVSQERRNLFPGGVASGALTSTACAVDAAPLASGSRSLYAEVAEDGAASLRLCAGRVSSPKLLKSVFGLAVFRPLSQFGVHDGQPLLYDWHRIRDCPGFQPTSTSTVDFRAIVPSGFMESPAHEHGYPESTVQEATCHVGIDS